VIDFVRLFLPRVPVRPAPPPTPAIRAFRPRAMFWCALGIVMLLTNMTFKGRPVLAVMTALIVTRSFWMLYRYIRQLYLNDMAFWTPARAAAWNTGQRDMALIADIDDAVPPLLLSGPRQPSPSPVPDGSTREPEPAATPDNCCCSGRQAGSLVQ